MTPPLENHFLPFEKPIYEIEHKINEFEELARTNDMDFFEEIGALRARRARIIQEVFSKLTPYQRVHLARHEHRPQSADYLALILDGFLELAGDRLFGDDRAVITGCGKLEDWRVMMHYAYEPERFRAVRVPVLLLTGSESPDGLYQTGDLKAVLSDARVARLEGQGHAGMLMAPDAFVREVESFLLGRERGKGAPKGFEAAQMTDEYIALIRTVSQVGCARRA